MRFTSLFLIFSISIFGTQLTAQSDFISGSWRISEANIANGNDHALIAEKLVGQQIHFLPDGNMIIESRLGLFLTSFKVEGMELLYSGHALDILQASESEISLFFEDEVSDRQIDIRMVPGQELWEQKLNEIIALQEEPAVDGMSLQGFYYHFDAVTEQYKYIRFFPNGTQMQYNFSLPPEDAGYYLNQAYQLPELIDETSTELISNYTYYPEANLNYWHGEGLSKGLNMVTDYLLLPRSPRVKETSLNVDELPMFPGCGDLTGQDGASCHKEKLLKHIVTHIKFPPDARQAGTRGTVVVTFNVEVDGRLNDIRVVRDIGNGCGAEAVRVVQKMNDLGLYWSPGMKDGEVIRTQFNLPIRFGM